MNVALSRCRIPAIRFTGKAREKPANLQFPLFIRRYRRYRRFFSIPPKSRKNQKKSLSGETPRTPQHSRSQIFPTSKFSSAFWLTTEGHLLEKTGHTAEERLSQAWAPSSVDLFRWARRRLFKGKLSESPSGHARLVNARARASLAMGATAKSRTRKSGALYCRIKSRS